MTRYDFMGPHEIITRHTRPRRRGCRTAPLRSAVLHIRDEISGLNVKTIMVTASVRDCTPFSRPRLHVIPSGIYPVKYLIMSALAIQYMCT